MKYPHSVSCKKTKKKRRNKTKKKHFDPGWKEARGNPGGKFWRWLSCRWAEDVWEEPPHREKQSHSNEMFFSEVGFYRLSSNKGGHERDVLKSGPCAAA